LEPCDPGELIDALAADLEAMERRPGLIRRRVEGRSPPCLPRVHLVRTLRALLRELARATAPGEALEVAVRCEGGDVRFELSVPLRGVPELGVVAKLPTTGIEIELAERVAALYGGRCTVERGSGGGLVTVRLPAVA
jgi:signal transduction histidine kinase